MTLRNKVDIFWKISLWSLCIFLLLQGFFWTFQSYAWIFTAQNNESPQSPKEFSSAYQAQAAGAAIAISTRIGMWNTQTSSTKTQTTGAYIYEISKLKNNAFIEENLLFVREYLNYSRVNIRDTLKNTSHREQRLLSLISGFETRAENAKVSITSLENQKKDTLNKLEQTRSTIEQIKNSMESHFSAGDTDATLENIQTYYTQREKYTEYFTQIVFINQFLKQYSFLIDYNAGVLDTMKVNKKALIEWSFVVIPESWESYLKPLNLIFDEAGTSLKTQ